MTNPWRFAGGYFDSSTGLYKFGTRYYNPGFGRWSQQDPVRGQLNDPTSLNRYLYASDDPANFTDPSGLWCIHFDVLTLRTIGWALLLVGAASAIFGAIGIVPLIFIGILYILGGAALFEIADENPDGLTICVV